MGTNIKLKRDTNIVAGEGIDISNNSSGKAVISSSPVGRNVIELVTENGDPNSATITTNGRIKIDNYFLNNFDSCLLYYPLADIFGMHDNNMPITVVFDINKNSITKYSSKEFEADILIHNINTLDQEKVRLLFTIDDNNDCIEIYENHLVNRREWEAIYEKEHLIPYKGYAIVKIKFNKTSGPVAIVDITGERENRVINMVGGPPPPIPLYPPPGNVEYYFNAFDINNSPCITMSSENMPIYDCDCIKNMVEDRIADLAEQIKRLLDYYKMIMMGYRNAYNTSAPQYTYLKKYEPCYNPNCASSHTYYPDSPFNGLVKYHYLDPGTYQTVDEVYYRKQMYQMYTHLFNTIHSYITQLESILCDIDWTHSILMYYMGFADQITGDDIPEWIDWYNNNNPRNTINIDDWEDEMYP